MTTGREKMKMVEKVRLRALAMACVASLVLVACGAGEEPSPGGEETSGPDEGAEAGGETDSEEVLGPVTLGTLASGAFVVAYVASELGYFEAAGVEVNVEEVAGGVLAQSLAAGQVEFGIFAGQAIYEPRFAGSDAIMVASYVRDPLMKVMGSPEHSSIEDLEGRRLAVGVENSLSTIFLNRVLRDHGLDPATDVQGQVIQSPGDQLTALVSGQVEAAVVSPPSHMIAEREGMTELFDLGDLEDFHWPRAALLTTESYAEDNREVVVRVIRGLIAAIEDWDDRPEEIMEVMASVQESEVDELIEEAYRLIGAALDAEAIVHLEESASVLEELERIGIDEAADHEPDEFFDNSYVEEALG
jgi:NitT/TauT family transport system substrate-binding protein